MADSTYKFTLRSSSSIEAIFKQTIRYCFTNESSTKARFSSYTWSSNGTISFKCWFNIGYSWTLWTCTWHSCSSSTTLFLMQTEKTIVDGAFFLYSIFFCEQKKRKKKNCLLLTSFELVFYFDNPSSYHFFFLKEKKTSHYYTLFTLILFVRSPHHSVWHLKPARKR